jgi:hypothetical protein
VPVGVTGHRTQRPRGQVGPPGPHPAQTSSSLDPGGERGPITRPLAPLIAQLVGPGFCYSPAPRPPLRALAARKRTHLLLASCFFGGAGGGQSRAMTHGGEQAVACRWPFSF